MLFWQQYNLQFENALGAVNGDVEPKECGRGGNCASLHHLRALATVTECQINVLYLSFNQSVSPFFNTTVSPLEAAPDAQSGTLTVLWTNIVSSAPQATGFWQPNHFVPVLFYQPISWNILQKMTDHINLAKVGQILLMMKTMQT